jgi:hypothetical protein
MKHIIGRLGRITPALLVIAGCGSKGTQELGSVHVASAALTRAQGGTVEVLASSDAATNTLAGTKVEVPKNALQRDTTITIDFGPDTILDADSDAAGPAVELGPDGTEFDVPVRITVPHPSDYDPDDVRIYVRQTDGTLTVLLPDQTLYDATQKSITFEATHFTRFQAAHAHGHCKHVHQCPSGICRHGHCLPTPPPEHCAPADCGADPIACPLVGGAGGTGTGGNGGMMVQPPECIRAADGSCHWSACPQPIAGCSDSDCQSPRPGAPNVMCSDGSLGGPVCQRDSAGTCSWEIRQCPVSGCDPTTGVMCPTACGPNDCANLPRPGVPNEMCPDGSLGGPVCAFNLMTQSCGWQIVSCPPVCTTSTTVMMPGGMPTPVPPPCPVPPPACGPMDCGPAPLEPTVMCPGGGVGGPTGQCIRDPSGACHWEILQCPPSCAGTSSTATPPTEFFCCLDGLMAGSAGQCQPVTLRSASGSCSLQPNMPTNGFCHQDSDCAWLSHPTPTTMTPTVSCPPGAMCDPTTGQCVPSGGGTCGTTSCGANEYCCSPSCGICAPIGGACPNVACAPASCGSTIGPNGMMVPGSCPMGEQCDPMTSQCVPIPPAPPPCDPMTGSCMSACTPMDCGPQPGIPTWMCADGRTGGFTGQCVPTPPNALSPNPCQWEIVDCPRACDPVECGPQPLGPNYLCSDGHTIAGPTNQCLPAADGTCHWVIISCPL